MSKRITADADADNVKLKRAYEPSAADEGTCILIDRLCRSDLTKAFQRVTQDELLPDGWDRVISTFPVDEKIHGHSRCRAEGHERRCASIAGADWRFSGFVPVDRYHPSRLGDFEHAGRSQSLFRCTRARHAAILNGLVLGK